MMPGLCLNVNVTCTDAASAIPAPGSFFCLYLLLPLLILLLLQVFMFGGRKATNTKTAATSEYTTVQSSASTGNGAADGTAGHPSSGTSASASAATPESGATKVSDVSNSSDMTAVSGVSAANAVVPGAVANAEQGEAIQREPYSDTLLLGQGEPRTTSPPAAVEVEVEVGIATDKRIQDAEERTWVLGWDGSGARQRSAAVYEYSNSILILDPVR